MKVQSIYRTVKNAGQAAGRVAVAMATGKVVLVSPAIQTEREAICNACQYNVKGRCQLCGCSTCGRILQQNPPGHRNVPGWPLALVTSLEQFDISTAFDRAHPNRDRPCLLPNNQSGHAAVPSPIGWERSQGEWAVTHHETPHLQSTDSHGKSNSAFSPPSLPTRVATVFLNML